jgi:hypothetical protein
MNSPLANLSRAQRRQLERDNAKWPRYLVRIPEVDWTACPRDKTLIEIWRSRAFFVQVHREDNGIVRLSVNRTEVAGECWVDGITWDELQQIKREVGRGALDALEVYPADRHIVNVGNLRHLWVMPEPLTFGWR